MYKQSGENSDGHRDRGKPKGLQSTGVGKAHFAEHHFSAHFLALSLLQPHWPLCSSSNMPSSGSPSRVWNILLPGIHAVHSLTLGLCLNVTSQKPPPTPPI